MLSPYGLERFVANSEQNFGTVLYHDGTSVSGVGHPYVFNCNEYCQGTNRASGSCEAANATSPYTGKVIASAYCKCVAFHTPRTADDVWSIESRF